MYIPPMAVSPFDTEHMSDYTLPRGQDLLQTLWEAARASTTSAIPTPGTAPEGQPVHDPSRAQAISILDETEAVQHEHDSAPTSNKRKRPNPAKPSAKALSFVDETADVKTAYDSAPTSNTRKGQKPPQPSARRGQFVISMKGGGVTVRRIRQLLHIKTLTSLLHSEWTGRTHARTV
jgi:hypothetical protein